MPNWVDEDKKRLKKKVSSYIAENGTETIKLPLYDFFVMLEALETVCDEYGYSDRVEEIEESVYRKYMGLNVLSNS